MQAHQLFTGHADGLAGALGGRAARGAPGVGQPEGIVVVHLHLVQRQRPLVLWQRLAQLVHRHLHTTPNKVS